jgi:Fe2+ or Zn2+ uptake regulation protein
MAETRVTVTRRKFVEILSEQPRITFTELKEKLVTTKIMNLATLYRIVEAFKNQSLLHEMTIAGERVIFPCQCMDQSDDKAITISFCENCGTVYDKHHKLASNMTMSEAYERLKSCPACVIH